MLNLDEKRKRGRERWRRAYTANPEKYREYPRRWRLNNPERYKELLEANRDQQREARKRWREAHPDYGAAYARAWRIAHPEQVLLQNHKRRVLKKYNGGGYTDEDIKYLFELQNGRCFYCNELIYSSLDKHMQRDHVVPLALGGSNNIYNIVLTDDKCNQRRHTKDAFTFLNKYTHKHSGDELKNKSARIKLARRLDGYFLAPTLENAR